MLLKKLDLSLRCVPPLNILTSGQRQNLYLTRERIATSTEPEMAKPYTEGGKGFLDGSSLPPRTPICLGTGWRPPSAVRRP
ncbi:hypothetical protein SK128_023699 [Halocaridina rubra]|uniref:Uncharacterized protein n=1 Tax=Halocaridina rubra TaxID=373956 RepID=A0AAN8X8B1_HALRR